MPRIGYIDWRNGDGVADLVLYTEFDDWHPTTQLDALFDIKSDVEQAITKVTQKLDKLYPSERDK